MNSNVIPPNALKDKLKELYRSQNEIPKLIEIDEEKLRQTWDEHFIELTLLSRQKPKDKTNNETEETKEFKLENVFNIDSSSEICKVLFLGVGGAGKSTLLHYISYKWGKDELWGDRFDIVFRVRLKHLLNSKWKTNYDDERQLKRDKFVCFIHHNLKLQCFDLEKDNKETLETQQISVDDIFDSFNKERVLLLVDGYNEVSHLTSRKDTEFQEILNAINQYKYTIISSRPNAFKINDMDNFDRLLEIKSLDLEKVMKYINSFHRNEDDLNASLALFLERNNQIRGICEIPINMVLLCLIWGDENIKETFQNNFDVNIQLLYREVILWLGKKYLVTFDNWEPEHIVPSTVFEQEIILFLQKIAFDSFAEQGNFVSNKLIRKHLGKLNIGNIYKFGILTVVGFTTDIVNLEYQFIHPTFQEFLTALHLNNKLASNDRKEVTVSCNLIGRHRNEPKYLMVLKFLAGIVSSQQFEDEEECKERLVQRTWLALTCNVDGVLEFGLDAKVTLLMHLLEQSKVNGDYDKRIPNLNLIKETVEDEVLKDISKWREQIIESGFVSDKIKDKVFLIITNNSQFNLEVKVAVEIITSLVNNMIFGSRQSIFCQIMQLLNSSDWQMKKLGLQYVGNIIDKTVSEDVLAENVRIFMQLVGDRNLKEQACNFLLKSVTLIPCFAEELVTFLGNIITDPKLTDDYVKESAVEFIPKLLQVFVIKNVEPSTSVIKMSLKYLTMVIDDLKINDAYRMIKMGTMRMQDPNGCIEYKFAAVTALADLIALQHPEIDLIDIIHLLTSLIGISIVNNNFKERAMRSIVSSLKKLPQGKAYEISYESYLCIVKELNTLDFKDQLWTTGTEFLLKLTKMIESDQASILKGELFNKFFTLIENSKQVSGYNSWAPRCMLLLIQSYNNEDVWEKVCEVLDVLVDIVEKSPLDDQRKNVFVFAIGDYISFICQFKSQGMDMIHSQIERVFHLFGVLVQNPNANCNFKSAIVVATQSIVKNLVKNDLINTMFEPPLRFVMKLCEELKKENERVTIFAICNGIAELIKIVTLLQNSAFLNVIYKLFRNSLEDPENVHFRDTALLHVVTIVKFMLPHVENQNEIVVQTYRILTNFLPQSINNYDKSNALKRIAELIEIAPPDIRAEFAKEACSLFFDIVRNNKDEHQPLAALEGINKIISYTSPELQSKILNVLISLLFQIIGDESVPWNSKADVKYAAVNDIPQVLSLLPDYEKPTEGLKTCRLLISVFDTESKNVDTRLIQSYFFRGIKKIVIMMNLKDSFELMKSVFPKIRLAVIKGLSKKFKSEELQISYIFIIDILEIVNSSKGQEKGEKRLYEVAMDRLEKLADNMNEEGLRWIVDNFRNMPSVIETKIILKRLYHKVLSDIHEENKMNNIHKQFIVKCIEYGLTTTVKRKFTSEKEKLGPMRYELVFENISYSFTNVSEFELESVVDVALKQDNILAKQYQEYEPLFRNNGTRVGLPVAASDFKISSLVDESCVLHSEVWCMSLLHLSDQNKSKPSTVFVLIEGRNHFGYHLVHKVHVENQKLRVTSYEHHPCQINTGFCTEIFGQMHYDFLKLIKPRYYVSLNYPILSEEGEILIKSLQNSNTLESNDEYEILHQHFQEYFDNILWDEYKIGHDVIEIKKDFLLKVDTSRSDEARRFSQIIDKLSVGNEMKEQQKELEEKILSLEKELRENSTATQGDKIKIQHMLDKLKSLEKMNSEQRQRIVEMTESIHMLLSEGELSAERIISLEQQCDQLQATNTQIQALNAQIPQFNDPNINYFGSGESNDDSEYYLDLR